MSTHCPDCGTEYAQVAKHVCGRELQHNWSDERVAHESARQQMDRFGGPQFFGSYGVARENQEAAKSDMRMGERRKLDAAKKLQLNGAYRYFSGFDDQFGFQIWSWCRRQPERRAIVSKPEMEMLLKPVEGVTFYTSGGQFINKIEEQITAINAARRDMLLYPTDQREKCFLEDVRRILTE